MKKKIVLLLYMLTGIFMANSQTDVWSGDLDVQGTKLPVVFHLDEGNPTLDSPAQGVKGLPMKITKADGLSIIIEIPSIGASFKGLCGIDRIIGKFNQLGAELPLVLTPGDKIPQRPQTPQPPYPYSIEEVSFTNGDAVLQGTLTLPEGYDRGTPVVIMVTGSGLQNRDEEIFDHKPFAVIADALAKNGIASLRYDDRGYGESTGDAVNCTTEDLMNDALSGIDLLRHKFNKVGVLGHSEGGTIAFMLGAEGKIDFIVSLAGMVVSGKETLLDQNRLFLSQAGYPKETVENYCAILRSAFDGDGSLPRDLETSDLPKELKQNLLPAFRQLETPYMQYFLALDMRDKLGNIGCPVFAINGTMDTQVFHENNLGALKAGLPSNNANKILAIDGVNHMFQHCMNGSVNEYATIEETISPEVLEMISQWINSLQ
ncbi:MAG: alpha/beta hydrolase [Muribaculaceae bacterium]|nr:alpha/beta hydrolase [Muribaculaceae bacterium]